MLGRLPRDGICAYNLQGGTGRNLGLSSLFMCCVCLVAFVSGSNKRLICDSPGQPSLDSAPKCFIVNELLEETLKVNASYGVSSYFEDDRTILEKVQAFRRRNRWREAPKPHVLHHASRMRGLGKIRHRGGAPSATSLTINHLGKKNTALGRKSRNMKHAHGIRAHFKAWKYSEFEVEVEESLLTIRTR